MGDNDDDYYESDTKNDDYDSNHSITTTTKTTNKTTTTTPNPIKHNNDHNPPFNTNVIGKSKSFLLHLKQPMSPKVIQNDDMDDRDHDSGDNRDNEAQANDNNDEDAATTSHAGFNQDMNDDDPKYNIPPYHDKPKEFFYDQIKQYQPSFGQQQDPKDRYWCILCNTSVRSRTKHGDRHQRFFEFAACGHDTNNAIACYDCYLQFSINDALDEHLKMGLPGQHRTMLPNKQALHRQSIPNGTVINDDDGDNHTNNLGPVGEGDSQINNDWDYGNDSNKSQSQFYDDDSIGHHNWIIDHSHHNIDRDDNNADVSNDYQLETLLQTKLEQSVDHEVVHADPLLPTTILNDLSWRDKLHDGFEYIYMD